MTTPTLPPPNGSGHFLLNEELVSIGASPGRLVLDLLRRDRRLVGTKEGCREGDCGACSVLLGELGSDGAVTYRAVPACMLLAGHLAGRHVVTLEGLNLPATLTPQQDAIVTAGASQCGFCTPGFVVSFTGFLLNATEFTVDEAVTAIGGNLCRCTGYVSLVRAARELVTTFGGLVPPGPARIEALVAAEALPKHFLEAQQRLVELRNAPSGHDAAAQPNHPIALAGGTDVIVQRGAALDEATPRFLVASTAPRAPDFEANELIIPAAASFEDLRRSPAFAEVWPTAREDLELFASAIIRERATVAGNLANASPIADGTAMLLALDAELELGSSAATRRLPLAQFYRGYKQLDLAADERILSVRIAHDPRRRVHFEKLSKRTYLDIATVNSGLGVIADESGRIESITISAGGVAPTPLLLRETAAFLTGKTLTAAQLQAAAPILDAELSPIDDVRGSAAYKRLALRQLFFAHFLALFPAAIDAAELMESPR